MRKWQILEFDGKPYYAFVPENESPLDESFLTEEDEEDTSKNAEQLKLTALKDELLEYSSEDENFYEEFEELADNDDEKTAEISRENEDQEKEFQVNLGESKVLFQKLDLNVLNSKVETIEAEDVEPEFESLDEDEFLESSPTKTPGKRSTRSSSDGALKCKICSETFATNLLFKKHVAWSHKRKVYIKENGVYVCCVCDYKTVKKNLFASHIQRKHETMSEKKQNPPVYPCAACGFECRSKHSLQSHFIRKHTDKFEHQCKFCNKKFKVKGDLTNHVRFHHKEKPINCEVCGKLCLNSGSLYVHQKWAHFKPKFECPVCHRRMVTQENLKQHMVSQHEKREKIVCAECGKTFTKKDSFKRHMAVHTGTKPFACVICQKHFARRSQLRQHLLIHTGKKPFVCDICGKAFTQKPGLICHRKIHPGPHPPLPVMPIGDIVKEFTEGFYVEPEIESQDNE